MANNNIDRLINPTTGESFLILKKSSWMPQHYKGFIQEEKRLIKYISASSYYLYSFFKLTMGKGNHISFLRAHIATELGMSLRSVREAVRELMKFDVIREDGQSNYILNPQFAYNGPEEGRKKALQDYNGLPQKSG